jgi:hypothetical protein
MIGAVGLAFVLGSVGLYWTYRARDGRAAPLVARDGLAAEMIAVGIVGGFVIGVCFLARWITGV